MKINSSKHTLQMMILPLVLKIKLKKFCYLKIKKNWRFLRRHIENWFKIVPITWIWVNEAKIVWTCPKRSSGEKNLFVYLNHLRLDKDKACVFQFRWLTQSIHHLAWMPFSSFIQNWSQSKKQKKGMLNVRKVCLV